MTSLHAFSVEAAWEPVAIKFWVNVGTGERGWVLVTYVTAGADSWLVEIPVDLSGDKRERFREAYGL